MEHETRTAGPVGVAVVGYGYWGPNLARNVAGGRGHGAARRSATSARTPAPARRKLHPTAQRHRRLGRRALRPGRRGGRRRAADRAAPPRRARGAATRASTCSSRSRSRTSVAECDELIAAAERAGTVLMAGHTFEFNAAVEAVREYLDAGELGEPYYVSMRRTNLGIVRSRRATRCGASRRTTSRSSATGSTARRSRQRDRRRPAAARHPGRRVPERDVRERRARPRPLLAGWTRTRCARRPWSASRKMVLYDDVSPDQKIWLYDKGIVREEVEPPRPRPLRGLRPLPDARPRRRRADPEGGLEGAAGARGDGVRRSIRSRRARRSPTATAAAAWSRSSRLRSARSRRAARSRSSRTPRQACP